MTISKDVLNKYVLKEPYDKSLFFETLDELIKVVIRTHFSGYINNHDLWSLSYVKIFKLLQADFIDVKHNLVNFLYTQIRNEVGNLVKRDRRISKALEAINDRPFIDQDIRIDKVYKLSKEIETNLVPIKENFKLFGIDVTSNIDYYISNYSKLTYYERFALRAATSRHLSRVSK